MPQRRPLLERFQEKFEINEETGCWEWTGSLHGKKGYGSVWANGRPGKAHRVSWELHKGTIPEGLQVLHKCDNPKCVNPEHLFLGTNADNVRDKIEKGRHLIGEQDGNAKLKEQEVVAIKEILRRHPPRRGWHHGVQSFLARWFGVTSSLISDIYRGNNWTHL